MNNILKNKKVFAVVMIFTFIFSIHSVVMAGTISDDVVENVQLSDGTSVEVHSNPYYLGFTKLEYKIIQKMQETAKSIGFDIETDSMYQDFEKRQYNALAATYSSKSTLDVKQVDIILALIDTIAVKLQEGVKNGTGSENAITDGFFSGLTEEEKDTLLLEIFDIYAVDELEKINIIQPDINFGITPSIGQSVEHLTYECKSDVVSGGNYLINDWIEGETNIRAEFGEFFDGEFRIMKVSSYPSEGILNDIVKVKINAVTDVAFDSVYFLGADGTVKKLNTQIDRDTSTFAFEINQLGYIAYGKGKTEIPTISEKPDEIITDVEAENMEINNTGKVVAPQTSDQYNMTTIVLMIICAVIAFSFTAKCKESNN